MQPVRASTEKRSLVRPGVSWVDPRGPMSRYASDILTPLTASEEDEHGKIDWATWEAPEDHIPPQNAKHKESYLFYFRDIAE